ncbi:MAG: hypothetical protein KAJ07_04620 [Planctomycetes bacterium]|nr:hypothetical protein [Planctomycetota bacterium]
MENTYNPQTKPVRVATKVTTPKPPFGTLYSCPLPRMQHDNRPATRIDLFSSNRDDGEIWTVQKLSEEVQGPGWVRALPVEINEYQEFDTDAALDYLAANGWEVRKFYPYGARAWKGKKRPVRQKGAIKKLRDQIRLGRHYVRPDEEGGQTHAFNLAFDL